MSPRRWGSALRRVIRIVAIIVGVILAIPATVLGLYWLDSCHNWGREFGYYEEYNRMRHLLLSLPGVSITREWHNHDVKLEEFEFNLAVDGRPVSLYFTEWDSVRTMPRDSARAELKRWIASELAKSRGIGVP